jgi:hypothetical protein
MTISFHCPGCGRICGFADPYAGRTARCTRCQERFIIPDVDGGKAKIVKPAPEAVTPGFFRAALVQSWTTFFRRDSLTAVIFLVALVSLRFVLANVDLTAMMPGFYLMAPIGWMVIFLTWGCQIVYYMETISNTLIGWDEYLLPEVGGGFEFLGGVIKSLYLFIVALILMELPFLYLANWMMNHHVGAPWMWHALTLGGFVLFPMALLILSAGPEMYSIVRPDYLLLPIARAPGAYAVVVGMCMLAGWFEIASAELVPGKNKPVSTLVLHWAGNVLAALLGLVAMRIVGLFGRHYRGKLPW